MKKNNSLLLTILGGAIFCFVFLGMAFIFTNNTKNMKRNSNSLSNNDISLGDSIDNCALDGSGQACTYRWQSGERTTAGTGVVAPSSCLSSIPDANNTSYSSFYANCEKNGVVSAPGATIEDGPWIWSGVPYTRVPSCEETCTKCEGGYYLQEQGDGTKKCTRCTAGSYCDGIDIVGCPAGSYSASSAQSECTPCTGNKYQDQDSQTSCKVCNGVVDETHTTCTPCEGDNTYSVDNQCITCEPGYSANESYPQCHVVIRKGQYLVSGTTTTHNCPAGTYSDKVGRYGQDGTCIDGTCAIGESSCTACGEGLTSVEGATSADQCVDSLSAITLTGGGGTAYVTPNVCKTYTITVKRAADGGDLTTEAGFSASTVQWTVSGDDWHSCSGTICNVKVCGKGCDMGGTVTIKATVGEATASTSIVRYTKYREWTSKDWDKEASGTAYIYDTTALDNPTCVGYSEPYTENGVTKYHKQWNRCCGTGGITLSKCYQDGNGVYHWSSSPESSWIVVSKSEKECKNEDACFEKPDGTRVWGKYYAQIVEGYKLITTIGDDDLCEHPSEEEACYVKDGDYKWSATALEGYTVAYTKAEGDASDCQPELCYINVETEKYDFGKYDGNGKYIKVYDEDGNVIKDVTQCKKLDEEACYEDEDGAYVWGAYAGDSKYKLVPEITDMSQCVNGKGDIPVPPTGINISKIIYIFMAILMACGVGFIYYSSVVKKNEAE